VVGVAPWTRLILPRTGVAELRGSALEPPIGTYPHLIHDRDKWKRTLFPALVLLWRDVINTASAPSWLRIFGAWNKMEKSRRETRRQAGLAKSCWTDSRHLEL
jgi:hypothetical protein